jgi:hypothetical protein
MRAVVFGEFCAHEEECRMMRLCSVSFPYSGSEPAMPRRPHPRLVAWARHLAHRLLQPVGAMTLTPADDGRWMLALDGDRVAVVGPDPGDDGWAYVEPQGVVTAGGIPCAFLFRRDGYLFPDARGVEERVMIPVDLAPGFTPHTRDAAAWTDALEVACGDLVIHDFLLALEARCPSP